MRRALSAALTTLLATGLLVAGAPAHAEPIPAATPMAAGASTFTPLPPVRVLDTRVGIGGPGIQVGPGGTIAVDLSGHVPADATAVVLNVTGVTPTAPTHVTVFPSDVPLPTASNLNLSAGDIRANQVTVALGQFRTIKLYNNAGTIDLVADLAGHYSTGTGGKFTPLPPNRVLDTRFVNPVGAGGIREFDLGTRVPASATAVTFNLTATEATSSTFVTAWRSGTTRPATSNLNTPAGDTRANLVTVPIGADRRVSLHNFAGSVHLIVDLAGFYTPDFGAQFVPANPTRVLDTRFGTGAAGPVNQGEIVGVPVTNGVPPTATGVLLNVTGVDATALTHVTVWGQFEDRPVPGSTLNLSPGQAVPNAVVVAFGRERGLGLHNNSGSVHVVADLAGVFAVLDTTPCTTDCVYAWGANDNWKLGTAHVLRGSTVPTPVVNLSGVRAVAGSRQNGYALRQNGTVWAWGANDFGQLGNGWTGGASAVPVLVLGSGMLGSTAIAANGRTAFVLRGDRTVAAWGGDLQGLLGNGGGDSDSNLPVAVSGLSGVVAISVNTSTAYALRDDGTVWAWGGNGFGALGVGTSDANSTVPIQIPGLTDVTAIASGGSTAYALRADGTVWAWGSNSEGQLGTGQPCDPAVPCESRVPVQVPGLTGVTSLAGGDSNGYAARADGTAWAWGGGRAGSLGNGVECGATSPCGSRVPVQVSNLSDVTQVASFDSGGYALRADGSVWAWGDNLFGSLGNDQQAGVSLVPVRVLGLSAASAVAGGWYSGYAIVPNP